jgi:hypothetical protein
MTPRQLLSWVAASFLFCIPRWTAGQEDPRGAVVILTMGQCCKAVSWPEAEEALTNELELVDVPVLKVASRTTDEFDRREELERVASERDAAAAVRLVKSRQGQSAGVELWIVDRVTGKTTYRHLLVDSRYDSAATIDVAVRVVEALRASLLELRMSGRQASTEPVAPEIVELVETTPIKRDRGHIGIGATSSLNLSPGGTGTRGAFSLEGSVQTSFGLEGTLSLLFSPLGKDLDSEVAVSTFDYLLVTGWVFYRFFDKALFQPAVGIGGGALVTWTQGRAPDGAKLSKDNETVAYLGGGFRLFVVTTRSFDLFLGSQVGATFPEIQARHGTLSAGRFGRPLVEVLLGARLRFS